MTVKQKLILVFSGIALLVVILGGLVIQSNVQIINSVPLMTMIDLLIIIGYIMVARQGYINIKILKQLNVLFAVFLVWIGLTWIAIFYLLDLMAMFILPFFVPMIRAMAVMRDLYLSFNWIVSFVGVGCIVLGFGLLIRGVFPRILQSDRKIKILYRYQSVTNKLLQTSLIPLPLTEHLLQALNLIMDVPWFAIEAKGSIFLWEEAQGELVLAAQRDLSKPLLSLCARVPLGHCLCGRAAETRQVVFSGCLDKHHKTRFDGIADHGHYCVPILFGDRLLGVLNLYVAAGHVRCAEEEEFLNTMANTLASLIERYRQDKSLHDMQVNMLAASKLATLGEVATGVAHEMNQPLTYISTFTQNLETALQNDAVDLDRIKKRIGTVNAQLQRIDVIIRHLQTFGRKDEDLGAGNMKPVNVVNIVENTLLFLGERLRLHNIALEKKFSAGVPAIAGHMNRLEQLFINFFQNAIQALSAKDNAMITVAIAHLSAQNKIQVKFSDNGVGMEPAVREKIFEPFFTTKGIGEGTGLGLAIVYGIVQEHGGTIICESEIDKGTTFTLEFPQSL